MFRAPTPLNSRMVLACTRRSFFIIESLYHREIYQSNTTHTHTTYTNTLTHTSRGGLFNPVGDTLSLFLLKNPSFFRRREEKARVRDVTSFA